MGLGRIYRPEGLALETAQFILGASNVYGLNVAMGCSNGCSYCYGPKAFFKPEWNQVQQPKDPLWKLKLQLSDDLIKYAAAGVFLSFATDPLLEENLQTTLQLSKVISDRNIPYTILSKMASPAGTSYPGSIMMGKTITCLDPEYYKQFEPRTSKPERRLRELRNYLTSWVSMEPYPCPAIFKQDDLVFIHKIICAGASKIVFGKWNYDRRSSTTEAREYYRNVIQMFTNECKGAGVKFYVKSDTRKFCKLLEGKQIEDTEIDQADNSMFGDGAEADDTDT